MNLALLAVITIIASGLIISVPLASSETVGAHVSKVLTDHTEPGYASAAILICAGNDPLSYPEIIVSSEQETKIVVYEGDVPANTCLGETVTIKTNNLSSITASLATSSGPIMLDEPTRDVTGMNVLKGMSSDGKIMLEVSSSAPISGSTSQIKVDFVDVLGNSIQHVNYDITVTQNDEIVLEESNAHTHIGVKYHETDVLKSNSPLDVKITLLGLGLPGEQVTWEGPRGEIVQFIAVPEFGTIVLLVLVATISMVVIVGARSKVSVYP
ncbi:hypothetical protein NKOR_01770 [Candidatus Nitrosopumilus koreensis AR1]|uniref:PEFG-CTERM sorting domain-containing protein n=1 Tax=Candidatus Nitrosopumilus koreensis AR1 TaxID=1229908 RepID=K0B5N5_9ARCH|nr:MULTISPECIES: PEFG-CTERM sorting domain-containing protein [Nitrosopumilus]AFS80260.1 hypothetical protein NKOR_01770 [Candidatus Nitrosopumilus koreensis AR1]